MKFINKLMKGVENLLTGILIADTLIIFLQVIFRYVLGSPLGWSEQICRLLFLWGVMVGIPVVFYNKADMLFDLLYNMFPFKVRKLLGSFFSLLGMGFSVFYFVCGVQLVLKTGMRMTSGIKMPVNVLYVAQPVCAALLLLVFIERLVGVLKTAPEKEEVQK